MRSEEGERPTVGRRRILGTVRLRRSVTTPHVFISFPRRDARPCTGPDHMPRSVFGLHRVQDQSMS